MRVGIYRGAGVVLINEVKSLTVLSAIPSWRSPDGAPDRRSRGLANRFRQRPLRQRTVATPGVEFTVAPRGFQRRQGTRADDGSIRAFYNVCRHRGTRLCESPEGNFPGLIRCPYHAWCFDLHGRLIAAPQMDDLPHFPKDDFPLVSPAIGLWDGHIFLNLSEHPPPLETQLADLPGKFRPGEWRTSGSSGGSSTTSPPTGS